MNKVQDSDIASWFTDGVKSEEVLAALEETLKYREEDAKIEQRLSSSSNRIPSGKKGRSMDVKL